MRPNGRLVRARDETCRPGQAGDRLQQVAVDDRTCEEARRDRPGCRIGAARGRRLRHRADRGAGLGHRGHVQGDPPPRRTWRAVHGRRLDQTRRRRRRTPRAEGADRLVRAGAPDRRQGSRRHHARRRHAVQRPPGHPDAAAADRARTGAESDRHLGRDRRAGAAHDAREPRRRIRRGQPSAARARPGRERRPRHASPQATSRSGATC